MAVSVTPALNNVLGTKGDSLAVHKAKTPVGRHDGAANDGRQLVEHRIGCRPHEEIEVQDASSHPPLDPCLGQDHIHGIAVQQHHPVRASICQWDNQTSNQEDSSLLGKQRGTWALYCVKTSTSSGTMKVHNSSDHQMRIHMRRLTTGGHQPLR